MRNMWLMTKTIVALHGFSESPATWEKLKLSGFEIVKPDLAELATMPLEELLVTLHEEIKKYEPFILLGYSSGGRIALNYALNYPVERLILESAGIGIADAEERKKRQLADEQLAQQIEQEGSEWFADFWAGTAIFESQKYLSKDLQEKIWQSRARNRPENLAKALRATGQGRLPYLGEQIQTLKMPTFFISGELDKKYSQIGKKYFSEHIIVKNAGHNVHLEQPDAYNQLINDIINTKETI